MHNLYVENIKRLYNLGVETSVYTNFFINFKSNLDNFFEKCGKDGRVVRKLSSRILVDCHTFLNALNDFVRVPESLPLIPSCHKKIYELSLTRLPYWYELINHDLYFFSKKLCSYLYSNAAIYNTPALKDLLLPSVFLKAIEICLGYQPPNSVIEFDSKRDWCKQTETILYTYGII